MPERYTRRADGGIGSIPETVIVDLPMVAASLDTNFFIADGNYRVVGVKFVNSVVGGAAAAVRVRKCTGTTAPASGNAVHTADFDLTSGVTANTVTSGTLSTTDADLCLVSGDRLAADFTGTLTGLVGVLQVSLRKIQSAGAKV